MPPADDEEINEFALGGTVATLSYDTDFHYYFDTHDGIFVDDIKHEYGDEIEINSNKNITTSISPKSYTVKFDLCGRGDKSKAPDQIITYKNHIARPSEQYDRGFVIGTWYLDYDDGTYSRPWNFDTDL